MSFKIADIDFVFLSYDEPNAEKNFADLKRKVPWAKHKFLISYLTKIQK